MATIIDFAARRCSGSLSAVAVAQVQTGRADRTADIDRHSTWEAYARWMAAIDIDDQVVSAAMDDFWDRWALIVETKPRTLAGVAVQLRAILWGNSIVEPLDDREAAVLEAAAARLDRLSSARGGR